MIFESIIVILDGLVSQGLITDYRYHHFETAPRLPFACFLETNADVFFAENKTWDYKQPIRLEFYTLRKDLQLEQAIETALADLAWTKAGIRWLDSENCYMQVYDIFSKKGK